MWKNLQGHVGPVGTALLDQSVIAGVGNVLRAEALFLTGVRPDRPVGELSRAEFDHLWSTLRCRRCGTPLVVSSVGGGRPTPVRVASAERPMETFLPFADFDECAAVLDWRVEEPSRGADVGRPREALGAYGLAVCRAWRQAGHADTCDAKIRIELAGLGINDPGSQRELGKARKLPPWLGDEALHRSQRAYCCARTPSGTHPDSLTRPMTTTTSGPCPVGAAMKDIRQDRDAAPVGPHRDEW